MILYHVSTDLNKNGVFSPRIPSMRHKQAEDSTTPRVSVAPTIEKCLTAIPNGGGRLDELNIEQCGYYKVFRIDTEELGIPDEALVLPSELYEKDLVRDADFTHEHWITVPFTVPKEDQFFIKVLEWQESPVDVFPFSLFSIAEQRYDGDLYEAYAQIYGDMVPCSVEIEELQYLHESVKTGEIISISTEDEYERNDLVEFLSKSYPGVEITKDTSELDDLKFVIQADCNLRDLFSHHYDVYQGLNC